MTEAAQLLLQSVQQSFAGTPDPRLREGLAIVVSHLHQAMEEFRPTHEEWMGLLEFLTKAGQISTPERQEMILLSDVLGLSTLLELINAAPEGATRGTVLGPYYAPNSPERPNGGSMVDDPDGGEEVVVRGQVRSIAGDPIGGAKIDVWSCASNGLYPAQDPAQSPNNLRGVVTADADGCYSFTVLRPTNYSVPTDGPVGDLMRASGRSTQRAAHVHIIASAPGFRPITTHVFDQACPYLATDAVFSVDATLVRPVQRAQGLAAMDFDIVLAPGA